MKMRFPLFVNTCFWPTIFLLLILTLSCSTEEKSKSVNPTKMAYDSLLAYLQKNPFPDEKLTNDSIFSLKNEPETKTKNDSVDSLKIESTIKTDSLVILSDACDRSLEKLEVFSKKMLSVLKKKREDPGNAEIKKEFKKIKEEFVTWKKRIRDSNSEAAWQKNKCNTFTDKKEKAEKIIKKLEEEIKK